VNKDITTLIFHFLKTFGGATLGEICFHISKKHGIKKETVRDKIYYLESVEKISIITIQLANVARKIYCLPDHKINVKQIIEKVEGEIISFLSNHTVAVTPELMEVAKKVLNGLSPNIVQIVLRSLVFKGKINRFPFLTSKNRIAYFYFLDERTSQIRTYIDNLVAYFKKNKCANVTTIARIISTEKRLAAYLLQHLLLLGELNRIMIGYIPEYSRSAFIYYVPGYKESVTSWYRAQREEKYLEHSKAIFDSLAEKIPLQNPEKVVSEARHVLQSCIKRGILRGRSLDELIISCFIFSLRKIGESVTVTEVHKHLETLGIRFVSPKALLATEKVIAEELEESFRHFPAYEGYVHRFVADLKISQDAKEMLLEKSREILSCIPRHFLIGKKPATIAAAVIYAAVSADKSSLKSLYHNLSQDEISSVSSVTTVSIRNRYRLIEQFYKNYVGGK
jgi:transcription initiation factor TFIIIB Brf1 subunit/transcription initiation factor TFIIB